MYSPPTLTYKEKYILMTKQYARDIKSRNDLLVMIRDDLKIQEHNGVVNINNVIWEKLTKLIEEEID